MGPRDCCQLSRHAGAIALRECDSPTNRDILEAMEIFVSWSGARSRSLALELCTWLRSVNHFFRPWMSDRDLRKGDRWSETIGNRLAVAHCGVICVTPENVDSPWLEFEAGALSKSLSRVCPLLYGMSSDQKST